MELTSTRPVLIQLKSIDGPQDARCLRTSPISMSSWLFAAKLVRNGATPFLIR